jgi:tRNA (cmo5U34)-methyltransferase
MIAITRERLRGAGLEARVRIHHGYVDGLPPAARYDAATLVCVLHFLPDDGRKLGMLASIAQRLRPGGRLVLVDGYGEPASREFAETWRDWMAFIPLKGLTGADLDDYRQQVEHGVHFVSEARLRALLGEAGFPDVRPFYRGLVFGGWVATRAP